jgi:hypothetical protein
MTCACRFLAPATARGTPAAAACALRSRARRRGISEELESALRGLCRAVLPPSDDTVLAAVSIKGSAFLAWVQHVLGMPPFFVQSAHVAIGRDLTREFECQVNRIQVSAKRPLALKTDVLS